MNVYTMTDSQINAELTARHSRTSGSLMQKRERLLRFLDFEDQKARRNTFVKKQQREEKNEMDECDSNCGCDEARVARILLEIRNNVDTLTDLIPRLNTVERAFIDLDESYEVVVAENLRLNGRIDNLEMRLSHVENRSDSPPPLMLPESNPLWKLDEFHKY